MCHCMCIQLRQTRSFHEKQGTQKGNRSLHTPQTVWLHWTTRISRQHTGHKKVSLWIHDQCYATSGTHLLLKLECNKEYMFLLFLGFQGLHLEYKWILWSHSCTLELSCATTVVLCALREQGGKELHMLLMSLWEIDLQLGKSHTPLCLCVCLCVYRALQPTIPLSEWLLHSCILQRL